MFFFDDDYEAPIFERIGMMQALALLWSAVEYVVKKYERAMFSGPLDRRGYRQPGTALERAVVEKFNRRVRATGAMLARRMGATLTESEHVRHEPLSVTFNDLESCMRTQGSKVLEILEKNLLPEEPLQ